MTMTPYENRILLPLRLRSASAHVWTHVVICVEANFPPASARVRPGMCERTFIDIGIPILNLRRSSDRLRFVKGIPIRRCLLSEYRRRVGLTTLA